MKTPHTPTPWTVTVQSGSAGGIRRDARVLLSVSGTADTVEEVRAFVDLSVNSHDRLVKALRALVGTGNNRWFYDVAANALNDDIGNEARAALAEAEGEYR